jgi:type I restriction enzyme, S subunit
MSIVQPSSKLAITKLPLGWDLVRLKSIADIRYGLGQPPPEKDGGVPMIRATNIDAGRIIEGNFLYIDPDSLPVERDPYLKEGEIIVVRSGAYTGDSAIVPAKHAGTVVGYDMVVTVKRAVPGFVGFCLLSGYVVEGQLFLLTLRAAQPHLNAQELGGLRVPLPSLPEQQRIAAYLDASCAAIDAAVAAKRRQLETLDKIYKATIQRAVARGLTEKPRLKATNSVWMKEIPEDWQLLALKRISEVQTGLTLGKTYDGPLIERPYLRVANVQDGHLDLNDITTIEVPLDVARRVELRSGDVLMTEGGDLDKLGRGYIWDGQIADCLHQNHIFAVRCFSHKLLQKFLAYLTASQYGRDYFEATGKRTTNLASTNSTKVGAFPIPLPPLDEQARIVEFLDDRTKQHRDIQANIDGQIAALTAYRKSLIHECVTGQQRVTEADVSQVRRGESEPHEVMGRVEQASSLLQSTG